MRFAPEIEGAFHRKFSSMFVAGQYRVSVGRIMKAKSYSVFLRFACKPGCDVGDRSAWEEKRANRFKRGGETE